MPDAVREIFQQMGHAFGKKATGVPLTSHCSPLVKWSDYKSGMMRQ